MTDFLIGIHRRVPVQTCDFIDEIVKHDVITDSLTDRNDIQEALYTMHHAHSAPQLETGTVQDLFMQSNVVHNLLDMGTLELLSRCMN